MHIVHDCIRVMWMYLEEYGGIWLVYMDILGCTFMNLGAYMIVNLYIVYGCIMYIGVYFDEYGWILVYLGVFWCLWVYFGVQECIWVYLDVYGCILVYLDIFGCIWVGVSQPDPRGYTCLMRGAGD